MQSEDEEVYDAYKEKEKETRSSYIGFHDTPQWSQDVYNPPGPSMPYTPGPSESHIPRRNPGPLVLNTGHPHLYQGEQGGPGPSSSSRTMQAPAPQYSYQAPTPPTPPTHPTAAPSESPTDAGHAYRRLSSTDSETVDKLLGACKVDERRAWQCLWKGCAKEPFKSKDNARVHVHKHLGRPKLFQCITCGIQFASEDAAKRHRDTTQSKAFSCEYCLHQFARKDYRDHHQKKCPSRKWAGQISTEISRDGKQLSKST